MASGIVRATVPSTTSMLLPVQSRNGASSTATLKKCVENGIGSRPGVLLKRSSGDLREEAMRK